MQTGLSLEFKGLKVIQFLFAIIPTLCETAMAATIAITFLGFKLETALMLGFATSGVNLGVTIPNMSELHNLGFGRRSGIAYILIAASVI